MGIHPYELERYTPAETALLLAYAQAKLDALRSS